MSLKEKEQQRTIFQSYDQKVSRKDLQLKKNRYKITKNDRMSNQRNIGKKSNCGIILIKKINFPF